METVLGKETSSPVRVSSGYSAFLVLTYPYAPHSAREALGCLWLRGHCCLAGGLRSLKLTPHVFSFGEKADLA